MRRAEDAANVGVRRIRSDVLWETIPSESLALQWNRRTGLPCQVPVPYFDEYVVLLELSVLDWKFISLSSLSHLDPTSSKMHVLSETQNFIYTAKSHVSDQLPGA